jgi:hypothetical protein
MKSSSRRQLPNQVDRARLASLSRAGYERVTGFPLAAPLSDELAHAGPRELASKLRTDAWPKGRL